MPDNLTEILVFGSAIVDFICYCSRLPRIGETLCGRKFATGFGGKGANQCVAAAKLGSKTALIAKLGNDSWGQQYLENLNKQDVNTESVEVIKGETTGIAQITVADNGDNQIVIVTGANNCLSSKDAAESALFKNSKILICQLETPLEATRTALRQFKGVSILNGAPGMENLPPDLLRLPTIFCVNESEALLITKLEIRTLKDAKEATLKLIELGANTVIITLGDQGAVYSIKGDANVIHVKTSRVASVVDTTGAGDCFIGSLAHFLAKCPQVPLHQLIGAANKIAGMSVQCPGTQCSFPSARQVDINFDLDKFEWCKI